MSYLTLNPTLGFGNTALPGADVFQTMPTKMQWLLQYGSTNLCNEDSDGFVLVGPSGSGPARAVPDAPGLAADASKRGVASSAHAVPEPAGAIAAGTWHATLPTQIEIKDLASSAFTTRALQKGYVPILLTPDVGPLKQSIFRYLRKRGGYSFQRSGNLLAMQYEEKKDEFSITTFSKNIPIYIIRNLKSRSRPTEIYVIEYERTRDKPASVEEMLNDHIRITQIDPYTMTASVIKEVTGYYAWTLKTGDIVQFGDKMRFRHTPTNVSMIAPTTRVPTLEDDDMDPTLEMATVPEAGDKVTEFWIDGITGSSINPWAFTEEFLGLRPWDNSKPESPWIDTFFED